jgi:hypothetical protein
MADHGYRSLSGFVAKPAPDSPGDLAISKEISAEARPVQSAPSPVAPSPTVMAELAVVTRPSFAPMVAASLWPGAIGTIVISPAGSGYSSTLVLSPGDAGRRS